jgi:probable phosphoglycerate mutase
MKPEQTDIVLVRHGQTDANVALRIQGQKDTPLNSVGLNQAERVGDALVEIAEGRAFNGVYCSDLTRTRETLAPFISQNGLPVSYIKQLRERDFGWFEDRTYDEVAQSHPERAEKFGRREPDYDLEGGESLVMFQQRVVAVMSDIAARHPNQHVLVVTHGGVLDCVQRWARDMALHIHRDFEIPNTSVNRVVVSERQCEIKSWADITHLD